MRFCSGAMTSEVSMVMGDSVRTEEDRTLARAVVGDGDRRDRVISFDCDATPKGAQDFVMAGHDLVILLEAAEDFDVGGAGDAGGYRDETNAEAALIFGDEIDALNEVSLFARSGCGGGGGGLA